MKNYIKMKKAWLISWEFHSSDKVNKLKEFGIENQIIDILDSRQTFEYIFDFVKHIYVLLNKDVYNKILFARRTKQAKTDREEFFKGNLLHTCRQDKLCIEMMNALDKKGIKSKEYKILSERWGKNPVYISIGHNPSIYARIVSNLKLSFDEDDSEILEWDEPLQNGQKRKCSLIIKPYK